MWALFIIAMTLTVIANVPLDATGWQVVNDDVMGGKSASSVRSTAGGLQFEGNLSLDHGGGFASARRNYQLPVGKDPARISGFALRVRGDGKRYRLTVFTRNPATGLREDYHYQAAFETTGDEREIVLPLASFAASFRGRQVAAPPLDPTRVVAVGLQISDRQAGPFVLDVLSITLITAP